MVLAEAAGEGGDHFPIAAVAYPTVFRAVAKVVSFVGRPPTGLFEKTWQSAHERGRVGKDRDGDRGIAWHGTRPPRQATTNREYDSQCQACASHKQGGGGRMQR